MPSNSVSVEETQRVLSESAGRLSRMRRDWSSRSAASSSGMGSSSSSGSAGTTIICMKGSPLRKTWTTPSGGALKITNSIIGHQLVRIRAGTASGNYEWGAGALRTSGSAVLRVVNSLIRDAAFSLERITPNADGSDDVTQISYWLNRDARVSIYLQAADGTQ